MKMINCYKASENEFSMEIDKIIEYHFKSIHTSPVHYSKLDNTCVICRILTTRYKLLYNALNWILNVN